MDPTGFSIPKFSKPVWMTSTVKASDGSRDSSGTWFSNNGAAGSKPEN